MKHPRQDPPSQKERNDRLAAALKANIARRKAQARARDAGGDDSAPADAPETDGPDTAERAESAATGQPGQDKEA